MDEALDKLAAKDKVKANLVKLRYFCGLSAEQAAESLGISANTTDRYWAYARSWLRVEVEKGAEVSGPWEASRNNFPAFLAPHPTSPQ